MNYLAKYIQIYITITCRSDIEELINVHMVLNCSPAVLPCGFQFICTTSVVPDAILVIVIVAAPPPATIDERLAILLCKAPAVLCAVITEDAYDDLIEDPE